MTQPSVPSTGQFVRWSPVGHSEAHVQAMCGRDVWRVARVIDGCDPDHSPVLVVVEPVIDGIAQRAFVRSILLSQVEFD